MSTTNELERRFREAARARLAHEVRDLIPSVRADLAARDRSATRPRLWIAAGLVLALGLAVASSVRSSRPADPGRSPLAGLRPAAIFSRLGEALAGLDDPLVGELQRVTRDAERLAGALARRSPLGSFSE